MLRTVSLDPQSSGAGAGSDRPYRDPHRGDRYLRSSVRDSLRRLDVLAAACGVKPDNDSGGSKGPGGDEWQVAVASVERHLRAFLSDAAIRKDVLKDRSGRLEAIRLGHQCRKTLQLCTDELARMRTMNEALLRQLNNTRAMRKSAAKSRAVSVAAEEQRLTSVYSIRVAEHAALAARVDDAAAKLAAASSATDGWGSSNKGAASSANGVACGATGGLTGGRMRRPRLMDLDLGSAGAEEMRPTGGGEEEADEHTQGQMRVLAAQEDQVQDALDGLLSQVRHLKQQALAIRDELDVQRVMLDDVQTNIEAADEGLKTLNQRLKKVTERLHPSMCATQVICCILLLAVVGYLVYRLRDVIGF
eukprot:TRINITY_DN6985_c0_g1_i1.p1 TRINITY_DN6985_c0_g1~~TRINITY_DN6985_c0_g1_i1.p1  ORF type:complete len:361 (+),score=68.64 TRINITY_DN6985_c0_g1_i1:152-1234(+)